MEGKDDYKTAPIAGAVFNTLSDWARHSRVKRYFLYTLGATALLIVVFGWAFLYHADNLQRRAQANIARSDLLVHYPECEHVGTHVMQIECLFEKATASSELILRQNDLRAQQDMASATIVLTIAGAVGLIASVLGVILVYENLREMRRQTLLSQDIGESQTKAYVWVRRAVLSLGDPREKRTRRGLYPDRREVAQIELTLANDGQTPAINIDAEGEMYVEKPSPNALSMMSEIVAVYDSNTKTDVVASDSDATIRFVIFYKEFREDGSDADSYSFEELGRAFTLNFGGRILYDDVFGYRYSTEFQFDARVLPGAFETEMTREEGGLIMFSKIGRYLTGVLESSST